MNIGRAQSVIIAGMTLSVGLLFSGCSKHSGDNLTDYVLLAHGDSVLLLNDVTSRIPVGISSVDSAELFKKIVSGWVEDMVLTDMAKSKLPDYNEIQRMADDYRNRLIVMSYLKMMRGNGDFQVSESKIREFYDSHKEEMLTERPLVKGLLLKVPENLSGLSEIKRCLFTATGESLDELERKWATDAVRYDYFENTWVDWQVIAEQIPYRFFDPDAFLASTKNFETTSAGSVYLLHISDYLPTGSEMPYEFSSSRIRALLEKAKMKKYEEDLVTALIKRAIDEEKLEVVGYDPIKRCMQPPVEDKKIKNNNDDK